MESYLLSTPAGTLKIKGNEKGIISILFTNEEKEADQDIIPLQLQEAVNQLNAYFKGNLTYFKLPLQPQGTPFQHRVWRQLLDIPYGTTKSYQMIANQLGNPKVIRAAAAANGKNPIAIIIPCHRVIGSDGSLMGYAGGLHRKKWLLEHESPSIQTKLF